MKMIKGTKHYRPEHEEIITTESELSRPGVDSVKPKVGFKSSLTFDRRNTVLTHRERHTFALQELLYLFFCILVLLLFFISSY